MPSKKPRSIITERLELRPATPAIVKAALQNKRALGAALNASVPRSWPPEYLDDDALNYTLVRLKEYPDHLAWWMHFALLKGKRPKLIGVAGYKGPPIDGVVEIGYGIVKDQRRKGFASEAVVGLVGRALETNQVRKIIAETLPNLKPSIGVLNKVGFALSGPGSEPGVIRFELPRTFAEMGELKWKS